MTFALVFAQSDGLILKFVNSSGHVASSPGHTDCPCVTMPESPGGTWPTGTKKNGTTVEYSSDTGSSCKAWDKTQDATCKAKGAPSWCQKKWCWVDPCSCGLTPIPKRSSYFPNARKNGRPVYYSYTTCGDADEFTEDYHRAACPNQDTEAKCTALKNDDDSTACHWNSAGACIGKELEGECS